MSVKYSTKIIDGIEYDYAYSDEGRYLIREGIPYTEAIDPLNSGRKYTEGDIIPSDEPSADEATEADYISALAELGVTVNEED